MGKAICPSVAAHLPPLPPPARSRIPRRQPCSVRSCRTAPSRAWDPPLPSRPAWGARREQKAAPLLRFGKSGASSSRGGETKHLFKGAGKGGKREETEHPDQRAAACPPSLMTVLQTLRTCREADQWLIAKYPHCCGRSQGKLSLSEQVSHRGCVEGRKVRSLAELQPKSNQYLLPGSCFCSLSQLLLPSGIL